jgi:hypothetical protein
MDEKVLSILLLYETVALLLVEPLHLSFCHEISSSCSMLLE